MAEQVRTPYGRHAVEVLGSVPSNGAFPTYYGRPAVKPTEWRWLIASYLFVGGLAGAAQVIASVVDLLGQRRDRPLVSTGRYLALAGALVSPALLIADLKTTSRWYNMLRIFRWTSPMSIGAWALLAFGTSTGLAAGAQFAADVVGLHWARTLARALGVPAALAGGVMASYTGSLLAATSTPLWSVADRWLPALFGVSGTATAAAALTLAVERVPGSRPSVRRLERLALLASVAELLMTVVVDSRWQQSGVRRPLERPPLRLTYRAGAVGLGILAPLVVHGLQVVTGRELTAASRLASAAALVGGYTQRATLILAGKASAERPEDYFGVAQP